MGKRSRQEHKARSQEAGVTVKSVPAANSGPRAGEVTPPTLPAAGQTAKRAVLDSLIAANGEIIAQRYVRQSAHDGRKAAGSYDDLMQQVGKAFRKQFPSNAGNAQIGDSDDYIWVVDVYPDSVIVCAKGDYFRVNYTQSKDAFVFDERLLWQPVVQTWTPVNATNKSLSAVSNADSSLYAVKMLGGNRIGGLAVLYGDTEHADLSPTKDFFTANTDLMLDAWPQRPMFYDHTLVDVPNELKAAKSRGATDKDITELKALFDYLEANPSLGTWDKHEVKSGVGVWLEGQLDAAHQYLDAVKELIKRGLLRISTDSAPHLVRRAAAKNGTHELKRWPVAAASLTVHAAEPRLMPVEAIKSLYEAMKLPVPAVLNEAKTDDSAHEQAVALERERLALLLLD